MADETAERALTAKAKNALIKLVEAIAEARSANCRPDLLTALPDDIADYSACVSASDEGSAMRATLPSRRLHLLAAHAQQFGPVDGIPGRCARRSVRITAERSRRCPTPDG